jgi:RNA polymerase sigma-70 factor, ECF subfamily
MAEVRQPNSPEEVTELLLAWSRGDAAAFDRLTSIVYGELHRLARRYMARERRDHTLQTTALVHEAFLRIADFRGLHWKNRVHFFAISAQAMRRVLVDFARSRERVKRGANPQRLSLDECANIGPRHDAMLLALDDALECRVVEMKFFGGLTAEEIAAELRISPESVLRDWKLAKLWLLREMSAKQEDAAGS